MDTNTKMDQINVYYLSYLDVENTNVKKSKLLQSWNFSIVRSAFVFLLVKIFSTVFKKIDSLIKYMETH